MKTIEVTISIPVSGRKQSKRIVEAFAEMIEYGAFAEFDGPILQGSKFVGKTLAEKLGFSDSTLTIAADGHMREACM